MSTSPCPIVSFEDEDLICVDEHDEPTGHASKAQCHDGLGRLHRALSIFLFDKKGRVLLQQRSEQKRLWPGWWANTCCSHPRRAEPVEQAAHRRLNEELALDCPLTWTHRFVYHAKFEGEGSEYESCHVFVGCAEGEPTVNANEVAATRWITPAELDAQVADHSSLMTPWLRLEWQELRRCHWQTIERLVAG